MRIRVECYSGYRAEERPRRLHIGERQVEVADILARWLTPEYRYFKVLGDDGKPYLIRQPVEGNDWELLSIDGRVAPT
jgi:hypothetical protein